LHAMILEQAARSVLTFVNADTVDRRPANAAG
jgi:hypothetical protein